eukprot:TRINITY_DN82258_c0_g1_i1.p1 TRINITY_DN82258_c0_g1~~TRINITY_DN82258_c0_g1_i1.p1  ORF type:complete len:322 (-),score=117.82 TRINITY_DN82258_c0_g1_i1:298-1170(-)
MEFDNVPSVADATAPLSPDQRGRAVVVMNIAENASESAVKSFFQFCGTVEEIIQNRDAQSEEGKQFAIVVFEDPQSASTALLLSNALIGGSPINVESLEAPPKEESEARGEVDMDEKDDENDSSISGRAKVAVASATGVVASLISAGYVKSESLAKELKDRARTYDEQLKISQTMKGIGAAATTKIHSVDEKLKISEKAKEIAATTKKKTQEATAWAMDTAVGKKSAEMVAGTREAASRLMEAPIVQKGTDFLTEAFNTVAGVAHDVVSGAKSRFSEKGEKEMPEETPDE